MGQKPLEVAPLIPHVASPEDFQNGFEVLLHFDDRLEVLIRPPGAVAATEN